MVMEPGSLTIRVFLSKFLLFVFSAKQFIYIKYTHMLSHALKLTFWVFLNKYISSFFKGVFCMIFKFYVPNIFIFWEVQSEHLLADCSLVVFLSLLLCLEVDMGWLFVFNLIEAHEKKDVEWLALTFVPSQELEKKRHELEALLIEEENVWKRIHTLVWHGSLSGVPLKHWGRKLTISEPNCTGCSHFCVIVKALSWSVAAFGFYGVLFTTLYRLYSFSYHSWLVCIKSVSVACWKKS